MITLGLTGSIGMGKSTAAGMFQDMGIPVHDSDAEVHRLLGPNGAAVEEVGVRFLGTLAQDDQGRAIIDRGQLGRIVFDDAARKKELEDILHPLVRSASDDFKKAMQAEGHAFAVLDIPLLFETGAEARVDKTIFVTAPADVQKTRVMALPGMTEEKFNRIVASQMPDAEKRKRADFVVDTSIGLDDTKQQLQKILKQLSGGKKHA